MPMSLELENELLLTLSYFTPMPLEKILLELNSDFLLSNPELLTEDLMKSLVSLRKRKKVKSIKENGEILWTKIYPKRPWWKNFSIKSLKS